MEEQSTLPGKPSNGGPFHLRKIFSSPTTIYQVTLTSFFPFRSEPVTDQQILVAERSLYRARLDIHQRTKSLTLATSSAAREAEATASSSLLSRWTTSTPAAKHLNSLQVELKSMESMESEMMRDLIKNKKRKELREMGRTFKGRVWLVAGWCLSVYCVWRVFFVSLPALLFF